MARLGGFSEYKGFQNSVEINELATFAVNEHNKTSVNTFSPSLLYS